jgi:hypothetical protein
LKSPLKLLSKLSSFYLKFSIYFCISDNGCAPLLEVNDMLEMGDKPDWKCVFTYIQSLYKHFVMMPQAIAARAAAAQQ